jgi:hypothetical protein
MPSSAITVIATLLSTPGIYCSRSKLESPRSTLPLTYISAVALDRTLTRSRRTFYSVAGAGKIDQRTPCTSPGRLLSL